MEQENNLQLPSGLVSAVEGHRATLFLGAGASKECSNNDGELSPDGNQLRDALCDKFFGGEYKNYDLVSAADFAIGVHGEINVFNFIANLFSDYHASAAHSLIPSFGWRSIATTNYDTFVEQAYMKNSEGSVQNLVKIVKDKESIEQRLHETLNPVEFYKLHGCVEHISDPDIPLVLTHDGYDIVSKNRIRLFNRLEDKSYESTFIFCGYSLADDHIRKLISKVAPSREVRPTFYLVSPGVSEAEKDYWAQNKIIVIDARFGEFMEALDSQVDQLKRRILIQQTNDNIPIRKFFRTSAPIPENVSKYLEIDTSFVSSEMKTEPQEPKAFYKGLDNGFGCILQNLTVSRSIVDDVLYKVLSDDSERDNQTILYVLKGPAGNGKTIALKQVSWELATSLNRLVLWLNDGGALRWDVLEDLINLTGERIFLAVDRAAQHSEEIRNVLERANTLRHKLTVITTESDSNWYSYCHPLNSLDYKEFRVRYLSHREIVSLLERLKRHNCLGVLTDLPEAEQIRRFEETAERQLLVALHEVTLGERFETIVINEFNRIQPELARELYLDICTICQFGGGARAGTIRRISKIDFNTYESQFFEPLNYIVKTIKDPYTKDYLYMARHARVASLVFRGICDSDELKANQLLRIMSELDIGYSADKLVFDRLTKGHSLVKNMSNASSIRSLFEEAVEIATEAFVYQQWAIFESTHPDGIYENAKSVIEKARELDPSNRTIIHTQAEVARKGARLASNTVAKNQLRDMCRARLGELKENNRFRLATLAKLLTDELEEIDDYPDENDGNSFTEKLISVEDLLVKAKQRFPDHPEFFELEARLQSLLKDTDKVTKALEKAISAGARGDSVWVRLSKGYATQGDSENAEKTLRKALEKYPDSKVVHAALAHFLMQQEGAEWGVVEQHMMRSYDTVDRNYEARFEHAQVLFVLNRTEEAVGLFETINKGAPKSFRPYPKSKQLSELEELIPQQSGRILNKTESYLFVSSGLVESGLYSNETHTDEEIWNQLSRGTEVTYRIQFSRRGPQAVKIKRSKF